MRRCYAPVRPCPDPYVRAAVAAMDALPDEWNMVAAHPEPGMVGPRRGFWMVFVLTQADSTRSVRVDVPADDLLTRMDKAVEAIVEVGRRGLPPPSGAPPLPETPA